MNPDIFLMENMGLILEDEGEPMEGDIPVGDDDGEQVEETTVEREEETESDEETTMEEGDMDDDFGGEGDTDVDTGDGGGGGTDSPDASLTGDNSRKRKLMEEYNKIYDLCEDLITITDKILDKDSLKMDEYSLKLFTHMRTILLENKNKLNRIMGPLYLKLEYKKLLTLFLYIKMTILNYSDILKKFISEE